MERDHLLVLPDRVSADAVADQLMLDGFVGARVLREALAGEGDSEAHEWAVLVLTTDDDSFADVTPHTAATHGGWYDPDPRGR